MTEPSSPEPQEDAAGAALEEAVSLAFQVLKGLMLVLVLLFLGSGFFVVASHEVGYVRRLGSLLKETPLRPGLHWGWPVLERLERIDLRSSSEALESFDLFRTEAELVAGKTPTREGGLDPRKDGYLVSGDANLLHVTLTLRSAVKEPEYRSKIRLADRALVLQVLAERAAVQAAAHRRVGALLRAGKSSFLEHTQAELQASLDALEAGIEIKGLELERDLTPPPQTLSAFDAVTQAAQKAARLRSSAESAANRLRNEAEVAAARVEGEAGSEAQSLLQVAAADAKLFKALRPRLGSARARRLLEDRLLARALAESLAKVQESFLVGKGPLRIRLERDTTRTREELEKRVFETSGR